MKKSKFVVAAVLASMMVGSISYADNDIEVFMGSSKVQYQVPPIIQEGATLVQFRPTFEKLGLDIIWDERSKRITGKSSTTQLELQIGSKYATVNGQRKELQIAPTIIDGNTMVPLRFVGEASLKRVSWNPESRRVDITRGMELSRSENVFGASSYIADDSLSVQLGRSQSYVYEESGKVYVMWTKDLIVDRENYTYLYVSMAENGSWKYKNQSAFRIKKDSGFTNQKFFIGKDFYWRSPDEVLKISLTDEGLGASQILYRFGSNKGDREYFAPVYSRLGNGVLLGTKDYMTIVRDYDGESKQVKDIHQILTSYSTMNDKYVYSWETGRMHIYNGVGAKQLDINTGDMIYGPDGKDLVIKISEKASNGSLVAYRTKDRMNYLYKENSDKYYKYGYIDENLNVVNDVPTNFSLASISSQGFATDTENEIHLWFPVEFERKPVLKLTTIIK